ncbi:TLD-domain-containing protein [Russula brevipes]|nr:TLD-domain-containing protein [Russula brevipes]
MPSPLDSISPLIPVPAGTGTPIPPPTKTDIDDLFATLFTPSTPPASPLGSSPIFSLPSNPRSRVGSISTASSTDSDFGAFVSVPASEDPLAQSSLIDESPPEAPVSHPLKARAATARNQQGLLAELLEHQDDPMYWHDHAPSPSLSPSPSASAIPSGAMTPQPPQAQPTADLAVGLLGGLVEPVKTVVATTVVNPLLDALNEATSDNPFSPPPSHLESVSVTPRRPAPPSPLVRSPSLPPSPSRPSPPVLTRVQSTSTFSPTSRPSHWMSSFLTYHGRSPSNSPPARRLGLIHGDIKHGSPFAASPFVPASGAPGFDGDRAWNKGFDESNVAESSERRGVQLLGRKDSTRIILGTSLADTLRSHLPPRARLARSWTLLFSIDQHGISLHTLYARCGSHAGGTILVVRDADDQYFGAWVTDGIREGHGSYIGSGESFLWKAHGDGVRVFNWTGRNDYVALCEPESISFGGGDGHYGLYLDETLYEGSSARCPTFNNDPLCASEPSKGGTATFECVGLEVWGVGPS